MAYDTMVISWVFSPGTGSAFALLPTKMPLAIGLRIVQRLPVRIALEADELRKHPLQIGLSMNVVTHTRGLKEKILSNQIEDSNLFY